MPSVPVMMLQTLTDEAFDRAFGVATATAFRFVVGEAQLLSAVASLCLACRPVLSDVLQSVGSQLWPAP